MAYTPENNPYIPGDPYSYDLKWVVSNIKDLIANYTGQMDELKTFIMDYINSLDLSPIVAAELQKMYDNGDFDALIASFITDNKVLLVDTDQSSIFTEAEKETGRKNLRAGSTNPNLLDNPWFTVNQRNFTSTTTSGYTVDRWRVTSGNGSWTKSASGMALANNTAGAYFYQDNEDLPALNGKAVTISVMLGDGTVYSGTNISTTTGTVQYFNNSSIAILTEPKLNGTVIGVTVYIKPNVNIVIAAIKVEKGIISTLANDAPPCYAEELAKCQYNGILKLNEGYYLTGRAINASTAVFFVPWKHRAGDSGTSYVSGLISNIYHSGGAITASTNPAKDSANTDFIRLKVTGLSGLITGEPVIGEIGTNGLIVSNDL